MEKLEQEGRWRQIVRDTFPNFVRGKDGLFTRASSLVTDDIHFKSDNTFDLIILQAKFFIYECKFNKTIPQLHLFRRYLKTNFQEYKHNAELNMSQDKIVAEWCSYQQLTDI